MTILARRWCRARRLGLPRREATSNNVKRVRDERGGGPCHGLAEPGWARIPAEDGLALAPRGMGAQPVTQGVAGLPGNHRAPRWARETHCSVPFPMMT